MFNRAKVGDKPTVTRHTWSQYSTVRDTSVVALVALVALRDTALVAVVLQTKKINEMSSPKTINRYTVVETKKNESTRCVRSWHNEA